MCIHVGNSGFYLANFLFLPQILIWLLISRRTEEVKARISTISLFLTAALSLDGTFTECQQGNLAFIRVGAALCSADRIDSIHVIPTVLRCFNGLLSTTITQATFFFFQSFYPNPHNSSHKVHIGITLKKSVNLFFYNQP